MKIIGIVARAYYNIDNQKIFQINESIRRIFTKYDDVICIPLVPTEDINYVDIEVGKDEINTKKLDYILDKCDGFILPGGTYFYNFDEYVIKHAIKKDKPLLGICLGFQDICSFNAKNRIKFDMNKNIEKDNHNYDPTKYKHKVTIKKDTKLHKILNKDIISVNSVHHHKVDFELDNVIINAISDDGIIEGVEYPNKKFIIGVQWHPEYLYDENSKLLFDEFINNIK